MSKLDNLKNKNKKMKEDTKKELIANCNKNDAAKRSNVRLSALLRRDYNIPEGEVAGALKLAKMRKEIMPVLAEKYAVSIEEGRQGPKFVGKNNGTAARALNRILSEFKDSPKPPTEFEKAKAAITKAITKGLTEEEAQVLRSMLK